MLSPSRDFGCPRLSSQFCRQQRQEKKDLNSFVTSFTYDRKEFIIMDTFPPTASPDDQKPEDSQQIDQANSSLETKESALEKSNTQVTKPINKQLLSHKDSREMGRQQINKTITNYAQTATVLAKKKKREIEADVNQLFESIKLEMHKSEDEFFGTMLSDVQAHPIEWLWPGRIPLGKITLLDGDPGTGKSLIAMSIAASISEQVT
jgi:transcriptional regulator with AAA-type ATPase domain